MGSYIKYSTAKKCPMHSAIRDAALELLGTSGVFRKDRVVKTASADAVADSINWDFIRRMIEEEYGEYSLMPLAESFWKAKPSKRSPQPVLDPDTGEPLDHEGQIAAFEEEKRLNPGKFLASGYGKKTAGFGLVSSQNGSITLQYLDRKVKAKEGVEKASRKVEEIIQSRAPELIDGNERGQING